MTNCLNCVHDSQAGMAEPGGEGKGRGPWILADQLTLSQPEGRGADYALNIT